MRNARLLVALAAVLTTATGCKPLDDVMVAIFGRSMRDSRAFDPYENPRMPPEGAVPFATGNASQYLDSINVGQPSGGMAEAFFTQANMLPIGTGDAVVAGMVNPLDYDDPAVQARGQEIYERTCIVCHGAQGMGAGANIIQYYLALAAYNLAGPAVTGYSDQYIYGMIRVGRGLMPAYGHQIRPIDRWAVVQYVRQLQAMANGTPLPAGLGADSTGTADPNLTMPADSAQPVGDSAAAANAANDDFDGGSE